MGNCPDGRDSVTFGGSARGIHKGVCASRHVGLIVCGAGPKRGGDKAGTVKVDFGANYFILFLKKKQEIGENVSNFPAVVTVCRKFEGVPALGSYGVPSVTDSKKIKK